MGEAKRQPVREETVDLAWLMATPTKVVDGRVVVDRDAVLKRFPPGYDAVAALRGSLAGCPSLMQAFLDGRREDRELEERKFRRFERHVNPPREGGARMPVAKVIADGRIEFPPEIRDKYCLEEGEELSIEDAEGVIILVPADVDPIDRAVGIFAGGPSMAKELVRDRKRDAERDK